MKCIIKRALIVYPIAVLLDDVIWNIIQTNLKLIHFSIAGLIVTSLTLSDLGKLVQIIPNNCSF